MTLYFIILILVVSLLFYTIFAGADFGTGILEFITSKENEKRIRPIIDKAIGPVWEANHIWLILAVVIFFMGFPKAFVPFSNYYHIPLTLVLFGIIGRGTAFTFRHYDAFKDESQELYSMIFKLSSLWTSFWLGTILGSLLFYPLPVNGSFVDLYILPWANAASMSVGVFVIFIFSFLASTFLITETEDINIRKYFFNKTVKVFVGVVISGAVVLFFHKQTNQSVISDFLKDLKSIMLFILSAIMIIPMYFAFQKSNAFYLKVSCIAQVTLVISGGLIHQFPKIIRFNDGSVLTFLNATAPQAVLDQLAIALGVGVVLIFPFLIFLFKVFKMDSLNE